MSDITALLLADLIMLRYLLLAPGGRHNEPEQRVRILRVQAGIN